MWGVQGGQLRASLALALAPSCGRPSPWRSRHLRVLKARTLALALALRGSASPHRADRTHNAGWKVLHHGTRAHAAEQRQAPACAPHDWGAMSKQSKGRRSVRALLRPLRQRPRASRAFEEVDRKPVEVNSHHGNRDRHGHEQVVVGVLSDGPQHRACRL
jgi:hypothetical protein